MHHRCVESTEDHSRAHNTAEYLAEFRSDIEKHMQEEEVHLFPMLRAQLSEEKNKALTLTMNKEGFKVA